MIINVSLYKKEIIKDLYRWGNVVIFGFCYILKIWDLIKVG